MADMVIGDYDAAVTVDGSTNYLLIQPGNASTAYKKINRQTLLGVTGTPADISTAQNFTNKTLDNTNTLTAKDTLFTLQDNSDTTKQAQFQLSGITTATTRTYTLPNASSTLADIATAQTFTNKTLTSPAITGGTIANSTITVDAIGEFSAANGVTIDGLNIKDGKLNTANSVVTASYTDGSILPEHLVAATGTSWAWQSWSPSYTDISVGNGTVVAQYSQVGKSVNFLWSLVAGTTTTIASGFTISLPVTASSTFNVAQLPIGTALLRDVSVPVVYGGWTSVDSSTTVCTVRWNDGTANISGTFPITEAVGDIMNVCGTFWAA